MNDDLRPDDPQQESLNDVLAAYLEAIARGEAVDRHTLVANHAKLTDELAAFFEAHDHAARLAENWRTSDGADFEIMAVASKKCPTSAGDFTATREFPASSLEAVQRGDQPDRGLRARRFGDYEILEEIARGGMGVVYKARQISLNRIVAVKMILSGHLADESDIRRFRIEAEAAANLQHPNIIGIYEVGQHDGHHFFSMEYVAGENLSQIIRKGLLSPKQAARYVRQIAAAIDYAHRHGVTHRDIKPSNVLIDDKDQARVTDFGLAKRVECDQQLTASHQVVGTVPYMAPEQVVGSRDRVGPASDIYSIGALFYELLTRQPPFRGRTVLDTLEQIREHNPKPPRQINPQIPRELEMICLKCLEKNPEKRYRSAQELADDLERFLDGDSISISGPNLLDRLLCTLGRGHHDVEFRTWANMLFHFAWIVFAANFLSFLVVGKLDVSRPLMWLAIFRAVEFVGMALVFWLYRADWYPPQGKPARQLWALWLGYVAGSLTLFLVDHGMAPPDRAFEYWMEYPRLAILSSLGFIMMGSSYWGYCYGIGAGFLLLALILPLDPSLAPLLFGFGWGASLIALARHLGKLSEQT
ncbi:MAG: serine/threonine-protein kinase [Thermoguttaceae bacterium]